MVIPNTYPKPSQIYQAKLELGGVKQFIPASDCAITDLQVLVASTSCCTACQAACARIPGTVVGTGPLQHLQVASTSCLTACGPILATVVGTGPLQHPRVASAMHQLLLCTSKNPSHDRWHVPTAAPPSGSHVLLSHMGLHV